MSEDFLNTHRLEQAFQKLETYVLNVAKPAATGDAGKELQALREHCEALREANKIAAERVEKLMVSVRQKGVM